MNTKLFKFLSVSVLLSSNVLSNINAADMQFNSPRPNSQHLNLVPQRPRVISFNPENFNNPRLRRNLMADYDAPRGIVNNEENHRPNSNFVDLFNVRLPN